MGRWSDRSRVRKYPKEAVEDVVINCLTKDDELRFVEKYGMSREYVRNLRMGKVGLDLRIRLVDQGRLKFCPACGGRCWEEKQKLRCLKCSRIVETCCE